MKSFIFKYKVRWIEFAGRIERITPKVLNMNNPLQAEGAARGSETVYNQNYVVVQ
jgi:hypothetical protein